MGRIAYAIAHFVIDDKAHLTITFLPIKLCHTLCPYPSPRDKLAWVFCSLSHTTAKSEMKGFPWDITSLRAGPSTQICKHSGKGSFQVMVLPLLQQNKHLQVGAEQTL